MYDQIREDTLFIIFYSIVTAIAMMASCYLLFRRANAIAPDITPPAHLRRWAAAFLAALALNHVWYMPIFFLSSNEDIRLCDLVGGLLDSMTLFPVAIIVLLTMLQDRRRPLWPIVVMMTPIVVVGAWSVVTRSYALLPMVYVYSLLMCMGLIIYMVRALRQYGRWLRDNFADLEHKEVWQSFVVLAIIMLVFAIYVFASEGPVYQYAMQMIVLVLVCYLLWRVETLSDLNTKSTLEVSSVPLSRADDLRIDDLRCDSDDCELSAIHADTALLSFRNNIGPLLKQYCEEPQLYLQYDISLSQLATLIGINRSYLSSHFASQGVTYNAYINGLRIQHFINLYHETATTHQPITAQQLAYQSGFRSYSTFSAAFKQVMGMTATEWMRLSES